MPASVPSEIEAFKARLVRRGLAASTVEGICRHLAAILHAAHRDQLIARNPADGISFVIRSDTRRTAADRVAALTPDQVHALAAALPEHLRAFAWTQALAGLRPGEAMGLTLDRLDRLEGTLTVDRQLAPKAGIERFAPPKTPSSVRTLHPADDLITILTDHVDRYGTGPYDLVFRTRFDRPLRRSSIGDIWRRAARQLSEAGTPLPPAARGWHSLRHTFASAHLEAGTPITTVSRMLGHKTVAETSAVYSHMLTRSDHTRRNAVTTVLRPPLVVGADASRSPTGEILVRRRVRPSGDSRRGHSSKPHPGRSQTNCGCRFAAACTWRMPTRYGRISLCPEAVAAPC